MGGPYKRKKYHVGDTHLKKGWRTKRRTKDLDQVNFNTTIHYNFKCHIPDVGTLNAYTFKFTFLSED